jgi:hypothetical protein
MTAPTLGLDPVVYWAALRRIGFGQIVFDEHDRPCHHSDVLVPYVLAALTTLHQHEFIAAGDDPAESRLAVLTMTGTQLLDCLNRQHTNPGAEQLSALPATLASEVSDRGQFS